MIPRVGYMTPELAKHLRRLLTHDLLEAYFDSDRPGTEELEAIFADRDIVYHDKRLSLTINKAIERYREKVIAEIAFFSDIAKNKDPYPTQWMKNDKRIWNNLNSSRARHFCKIINALDAYKWKSAPCRNYKDWPIIVEPPYQYLKEQHRLSYWTVNRYLKEMEKHGFITRIKGESKKQGNLKYSLGYWCEEGSKRNITVFPYKQYFLKNTKDIRWKLREFDSNRK